MASKATQPSLLGRLARMALVFILVFGMSFHAEMAIAADASKSSSATESKSTSSSASAAESKAEPVLTNLTICKVKEDGKAGDAVRSIADIKDKKDNPGLTLEFGESVKLVAVPEWDGKTEKDAVANFVEWDVNGSKKKDEKDPTVVVTNDGSATGQIEVKCAIPKEYQTAGVAEIVVPVTLGEKPPEPVVLGYEISLSGEGFEPPATTLAFERNSGESFPDYQFTVKIRAYDSNTSETVYTYVSTDGKGSLPEVSEGALSGPTWELLTTDGDSLSADVATITPEGLLSVKGDGSFIVKCTASDEAGVASLSSQVTVTAKTEGGSSSSSESESTSESESSSSSESESSSSSSSEPEPEPEPIDYQGIDNPQSELSITARIAASALKDGVLNPDSPESSSSASENSSESSSESSEEESSSSSSTEPSSSSVSSDAIVEHKEKLSLADIESLDSAEETFGMKSGELGDITVTGSGPTLLALFERFGITDLSAISEVKFISASGAEVTVNWSALASSSPNPLLAVKSYVHEPERGDSGTLNTQAEESGEGSTTEGDAPEEPSGSSAASEPEEPSSSSAVTEPEASEEASASASESNDSSESSNASESTSSSSSSEDSNRVTSPIDNTRFRLMFDGSADGLTALDADSLRWINEIVINPGSEVTPTEPEEEDEPAPFTVSIDYAPAPIGQEAIFSPRPSEELPEGATFDFLWEESSDGGKTWSTVGTNQTYRTVTTKENIGHKVRVTLASSIVNEATGKPYKARSESKEIEEGKGFIVQLDYDPPASGGVALFQAKIIDTEGDVDKNKLKYVWQLTEDGGKNWLDLADPYQGGPTCMIQTYDSEGASEAAKLSYIRVHVEETTGKKRERNSNMQPLTVHTKESSAGSKDSSTSSSTKDSKKSSAASGGKGKSTSKSSSTDDEEFIEPPDDNDNDDNDDNTSGDGTEDGDDREDDPTSGTDPSEDAPTTDPHSSSPAPSTPYQPLDLSQVNVDQNVTDKILEQEKAVQEQVEATVPGARWTAISASGDAGDDARNVLAGNPFAPFAIPIGLGFTAAGGLEKLLSFRRQR